MHRLARVVQPLLPARWIEIPFAVATAEESTHSTPPCIGERARLQGGHSARLVRFLRKGMDVEDRAAHRCRGVGRVPDAKAPAVLQGQEKRFRIDHRIRVGRM
jgi:hypothetical protein